MYIHTYITVDPCCWVTTFKFRHSVRKLCSSKQLLSNKKMNLQSKLHLFIIFILGIILVITWRGLISWMPSYKMNAQQGNGGAMNAQQGNGGTMNAQQRNGGEMKAQQRNGGVMEAQQRNGGVMNAHQRNGGEMKAQQRNVGEMKAQQRNGGVMEVQQRNGGVMEAQQRNGGVMETQQRSVGEMKAQQRNGGVMETQQRMKAQQRNGGVMETQQRRGGSLGYVEKKNGRVTEGGLRKPEGGSGGVEEEGNQFGYIVSALFTDQMTGASKNILTLQCWAATVSHQVKVVEPFLRSGSRFGYDFENASKNESEINLIRLRDLYDIASWQKQTRARKYAPLISWEAFLEHAPRNLIVVGTRHSNSSMKMLLRQFAKQHNFTIVRYANYNFKVYSPEEFKSMVYGNHSPRHSVVVFDNWGGIHAKLKKDNRMTISNLSTCGRSIYQGFLLQNSQSIEAAGLRYQNKYLSRGSSNGYISVMLRVERFALFHHFPEIQSEEKKLEMLGSCVDSISNHVSKLMKEYGVESIFLAMDCGKHGSNAFRDHGKDFLSSELAHKVATTLHQKLYRNSSSLEEWNESFDSISPFKTPGYVAQLQKYLAYNGVCLLTAGGGSFQDSALELYNEVHQSSEAQCAYKVPEC